ncbi:hypothetical protein PROVALCAL_00967 [Providencia alcalifaciens DSM 30120]|uniref:Uncharacterized protein n=1 Tax=Providencia alcalifaciens DSM 30120 TaxID=520999 RepID=B6XCA4_9GAMM|nr:hypothetical protein PROVALCAL_00967 [Providencia alcalifaciens DSM 30120]
MRHNLPGETMNTAALFLKENTDTALPSRGQDSLFFPAVLIKKPLIEGLFFGLLDSKSC